MRHASAALHVATIERKHQGKTYVSYLLRRSFRQDGKVKHLTLGNLSHLPERLIEIIRRSLQGEAFVTSDEAFCTLATKPQGHVEAVLTTVRKLEVENLIASTPSRQRSLILALIVQRILFPCSKLASTRHWQTTTLAEELGVADATSKELYAAMDWLARRCTLAEAVSQMATSPNAQNAHWLHVLELHYPGYSTGQCLAANLLEHAAAACGSSSSVDRYLIQQLAAEYQDTYGVIAPRRFANM